MNNLEDIDTFKKYANFFIQGSKIVFMNDQEPAKIHMSSRFATFFSLQIIHHELEDLEYLVDFCKKLKEAKVYKDSLMNN